MPATAHKAVMPFLRSLLASPFGRREVFGYGFAAYVLPLLFETWSFDPSSYASNWHRLNIIVIFATGVCALQIWKASGDRPATRIETLALAFHLAAVFIMTTLGFGRGTGLPFSIFAITLLTQVQGDRRLRAAAVLMLALSANAFWGPALFTFFGPQILSLDSFVLSSAYAFWRPDVTDLGGSFVNPQGFGIVLVGACSVFNAITAAFLAYAALAVSERGTLVRRDLLGVGIICAGLLAMNTFRLLLTGQSRANYTYWHNGDGFTYLELGQTALILVASLVAVNVIREVKQPHASATHA